jgi:hypothetical protein
MLRNLHISRLRRAARGPPSGSSRSSTSIRLRLGCAPSELSTTFRYRINCGWFAGSPAYGKKRLSRPAR